MRNKLLILFVGILIAITGIVFYFGDGWVEQFAKSKIDKIEGVSYDSISIDVERQYITVKNFKVKKSAFTANVKILEVKGISLYELIVNNHINIKNIDLDEVEINYLINNRETTDTKINAEMPEFTISSIILADGHLKINKNTKTLITTSFNSEVVDLNTESVKSSSKLLSDIKSIELRNLEYHTKDSLYTIRVNEILHNSETDLTLKQLEVNCNYEKYELGRVLGHEVDWVSAALDSAVMQVASFDKLVLDNSINKADLYGLKLSLFRDKTLPFPENQRPRLMKEILADTSMSFSVDSVFLNDAYISYEEQVSEEPEPGVIRFEEINGYLSHLSTYNRNSNKAPHVSLSTKIMGKSTLYADISFPNSVGGNTIVKGVLNKTDLTIFNPMISNVSDARIKQGVLNSLDFEFSYESNVSNGTMNFTYEDLAVEFIDESGKNKKFPDTGLFNDIKTFVANALVIKKKNKKDKNSYTQGTINFERDMEKSMFNFWWKSILTGFKTSVGIKNKKKKVEKDSHSG